MRTAVGLLACLGAVALTPTLADPPDGPASTPTAPRTTPGPAAPSGAAATSATPAANVPSSPATSPAAPAAQAAAEKADLEKDRQHFLALGYKPEMRGGEQLYCRRETALGSRLTAVKNCGTLVELRLAEQRIKSGVYDAQRQQTGTSFH